MMGGMPAPLVPRALLQQRRVIWLGLIRVAAEPVQLLAARVGP